MTGTGTKADPYIIYTWDEFTTTIVQSGVYIELGGDIDCASLGPISVASDAGGMYEMNFNTLDGKGYAIRNLYAKGHGTLLQGLHSNVIKNLDFLNNYIDNITFMLLQSDHPMYYILPTFDNCHFSAECVNHSNYIYSITTHLYAAVFRKCTFHMMCEDSNFVRKNTPADNRLPMILDDCVVELYGTIQDQVIAAQLINTHVTGEVTMTDPPSDENPSIMIIQDGSYRYYTSEFLKSNSVIDIKVHNTSNYDTVVYVSGTSYYDYDDNAHACTETLFINTEDIDRVYVRQYATFKQCTAAQIHSEAYLKSQGFIAEETYNNRYVTMLSANFPRTPATGAKRTYIDTGVKGIRSRYTSIEWEFLNSTGTSYSEYWVMGAVSDGSGSILGTIFGAESQSSMVTWQDQSYNINDFHDAVTPYGMLQVKLHAYCDNDTWRQGQDDYNIYIGCLNWNGNPKSGAECKIYSAQILETDDSLLRDYVPAYDSIGHENGLYDKVHNVFYGNASSSSESPSITADPMPFRFVNGVLQHNLSSSIYRLGAFCNARMLAMVTIPESVKYIGRFAFRNTQLQSVKIASDCVYFDTSFPDGCVIETY